MAALSNVQPLIEPDPKQMLQHLEHLFGGWNNDYHKTLIEIAWTDGSDGKLRHATQFDINERDNAVTLALKQNRIPRQNIHVGTALRKPETQRNRRAGDKDVFSLPAFYIDLDTLEAVQKSKNLFKHCPPTAIVTTGCIPHERLQLWWRLQKQEHDFDLCRAQIAALTRAVDGDSSVVNPSRLMRLAGSIAWPIKPGRVIERTEFVLCHDKLYSTKEIANAFPPTLSETKLSFKIPASERFNHIRSGDHWHDHLVRLTARWVARGLSDAEILALAEPFTLSGYTVEETRREVTKMIDGARIKWPTINGKPKPPVTPHFVEFFNPKTLPKRQWVLGRVLLRGNLTILIAPPGVGKSTLGLQQAVSIVTGQKLTGQTVHSVGPVWIYNHEDDGQELHRRLAAVLQHWRIESASIAGKLALDSGADRPIIFAKSSRSGGVRRMPDVDACIAEIKERRICAFIVDPFVETHEVDENSNDQIKTVAQMFRDIARKGDCAVMLVHHTAKPPQGSSDGHAGNINASRGASALVGTARIVQTLFGMSAKDAQTFGIKEEDRHLYIRLDDGKANLSLVSTTPHWFKRVSVNIENGDEVGILEPVSLNSIAAAYEQDLQHAIIAVLLEQTTVSELSLNAAARHLAWSGDPRFARFRQIDADGHRRVSRTLREQILAACRRAIVVNAHDKAEGFTCNENAIPITLRRFSRTADLFNDGGET
ncbi:MAG: AAA family ATPase [Alphaproteobacteria bacterium]|nr:AAA family ATPase [Alphaproteobacteria bacterium]